MRVSAVALQQPTKSDQCPLFLSFEIRLVMTLAMTATFTAQVRPQFSTSELFTLWRIKIPLKDYNRTCTEQRAGHALGKAKPTIPHAFRIVS